MSYPFLRVLRLRVATQIPLQHCALFSTTSRILAAQNVDSNFISQITAAEKLITNQSDPVQGGPTARAQSHVGQSLTAQVVHDITEGERIITGQNQPVQNGPTAIAQSILTQLSSSTTSASNPTEGELTSNSTGSASGILDGNTIARITEKEKELSGQEQPVKGGPTAKAQQHAGEAISSQALHDITEGEKKITGGQRVKGGPTAKAQSELAKSRS